IRIEFTNQDVALLRNICCKPALSHLFLKLSFDLGETLGSNGFCVPFCKGFVSAGTNHSKLLQCHVVPSLKPGSEYVFLFVQCNSLADRPSPREEQTTEVGAAADLEGRG